MSEHEPDPVSDGVLDVFALVPDPKWGWLVVVDVGALLGYLADGSELQEAVDNAAIDQEMGGKRSNVRDLIERVRRLNNDGDANAYWNPPEDAP